MKSRTGVRLIPNEADACFSVERTALLRLWAVHLQKGLISTPSRRPGSACWRAFHRSVPAGCCGEKGILCSAEIFEGRKLSWKIYTENSVYIQIQYKERLCGEKRLEPGQWWEESLMLE